MTGIIVTVTVTDITISKSCQCSSDVIWWVQNMGTSALLDDMMQQLALICSFASFQPSLASGLPEKLDAAATIVNSLSYEQKLGLRDLARLIDGHLIKRVNVVGTTNTTPSESQIVQYGAPDSESESGSDCGTPGGMDQPPYAAAPNKPQPTSEKAQAAARKQGQAEVPAAAANTKRQALADSIRSTSVAVSDGDQRAANKRLQLRNKLTRKAQEAAEMQSSLQQAGAQQPKLALTEAKPSAATQTSIAAPSHSTHPPDQTVIGASHAGGSVNAPRYPGAWEPDPGAALALRLKPSKRVLKRERQRAAAAAQAASMVAQQAADDNIPEPFERPSTAEGTSSSSAASLVGSETPNSPASKAADVQPGQDVASQDADAQPRTARMGGGNPHAASGRGANDIDSNAAATSSRDDMPETVSTVSSPEKISKSETSDSKAKDAEATSGTARSDAKAEGSNAGPSDTSHVCDGLQADANHPDAQLSAAPTGKPSASSSPVAPAPQGTEKLNADTGEEDADAGSSAISTDGQAQAEGAEDQKAGQDPSASTAAVAGAPSPAAIAAHRPETRKVVLRASAPSYTPLSSKTQLANMGPPAAGARPAAINGNTADRGKKLLPGLSHSHVHRHRCTHASSSDELRSAACVLQITLQATLAKSHGQKKSSDFSPCN